MHCSIIFSAYELYADLKSDEATVTQVGQVESPGEMSMAKRFKSAFSHKDVKVHFVGAWYMILSLLVWISMLTSRLQGHCFIHRDCSWKENAPWND